MKKSIKVEIIKYMREDNIFDIQDYVGDKLIYNPDKNEYCIKTPDGIMQCYKGYYIIKNNKGEFYLSKPSDILNKIYNK